MKYLTWEIAVFVKIEKDFRWMRIRKRYSDLKKNIEFDEEKYGKISRLNKKKI